MHFLLLCCFDERRWNDLPQSRRDDIMQSYGAWIDEMATQGRYVGGAKLAAAATAICVSAAAGKPTMTDGPFAETKEQLGGYHILDCTDRHEALVHAARIPTLPAGGTVEVRPLQQLIPGTHTHP